MNTGVCKVSATQAGNAAYAAATQVLRSITLSKAANAITFTAPTALTLNQSPYALSATASSGLTVSFASSTTSICTVNGTSLTLVAAGTCTITASQAGDANYGAATSLSRSISIGKVAQSISFSPASMALGEMDQELVASASTGLTVIFTSGTLSVCRVLEIENKSFLRTVSEGNCSISAIQAGNDTYAPAINTVSLQISMLLPTLLRGPTFGSVTYFANGINLVPVGTEWKWAGTSKGFKWYRCTERLTQATVALPSSCQSSPISESDNYILSTSDWGKFVVVMAWAENAAGKTSVWIQSTSQVDLIPPENFSITMLDSSRVVSTSTTYKFDELVGRAYVNQSKLKLRLTLPGVTEINSPTVRWYICSKAINWPLFSKQYQSCSFVSYTDELVVIPAYNGAFIGAEVSVGTRTTLWIQAIADSQLSPVLLDAPSFSSTPVSGKNASFSTTWTTNNPVWGGTQIAAWLGVQLRADWYSCSNSTTPLFTQRSFEGCALISSTGWKKGSGRFGSSISGSYTLKDADINRYIGVYISATLGGTNYLYSYWWSGTSQLISGWSPYFKSGPYNGLVPAGGSLVGYSKFAIPEGINTPATTWGSSPIDPSLAYQWYRCNSPINSYITTLTPDLGCVMIPNESQSIYYTKQNDVDKFLTVEITADSGYGTSKIYFKSQYQVSSPPFMTLGPVISASGSPLILVTSNGNWTGNPVPTLTYAWGWCPKGTTKENIRTEGVDKNCWNFPGQTSSKLLYDNENWSALTIFVSVTATNRWGSKNEYAVWP